MQHSKVCCEVACKFNGAPFLCQKRSAFNRSTIFILFYFCLPSNCFMREEYQNFIPTQMIHHPSIKKICSERHGSDGLTWLILVCLISCLLQKQVKTFNSYKMILEVSEHFIDTTHSHNNRTNTYAHSELSLPCLLHLNYNISYFTCFFCCLFAF